MSVEWSAHATCAALLACDLLARCLRLRLLTGGAGHPLRMGDALRTNLLADTGAALSPMRLAGEPARIVGMSLAGVPMPRTLATITWEVIVAWPLLVVTAALLTAVAAPAWWATAAPVLLDRLAAMGPVLIGGVVALLVAAYWVGRWCRQRGQATCFLRHSGTIWRRMPPGPVLVSIPLTLINMGARTALLPALLLARPDAPEAAVVWYGSFLLTYGQLFLPTPAGVGAVEVGFLGGTVGALEGDVALLLAWRWWSTGVPILLGLAVGWRAWGTLGGWRPAPVQNED